VEDYRRWKKVFDESRPTEEDGFGFGRVLCDLEDPGLVTVLFEVLDVHAAKRFMESPDMKEIMRKAGVSGNAEVQWLDELLQVPSLGLSHVRRE
jgi:hypothetical protein